MTAFPKSKMTILTLTNMTTLCDRYLSPVKVVNLC